MHRLQHWDVFHFAEAPHSSITSTHRNTRYVKMVSRISEYSDAVLCKLSVPARKIILRYHARPPSSLKTRSPHGICAITPKITNSSPKYCAFGLLPLNVNHIYGLRKWVLESANVATCAQARRPASNTF